MPYVLITADFPGVSKEDRDKINECLEMKHVNKVREPGRDIDTVWEAYFGSDTLESNAIKGIISIFEECCKGYCKPKLVLHWGQNKPTRHGLV